MNAKKCFRVRTCINIFRKIITVKTGALCGSKFHLYTIVHFNRIITRTNSLVFMRKGRQVASMRVFLPSLIQSYLAGIGHYEDIC